MKIQIPVRALDSFKQTGTVDPKISDELSDIRNQIDHIDDQILDLLNQRGNLALEIGRQKKIADLPVYAPEREKAVLDRLILENKGPLPAEAVENVFQIIIQQVRTFEENHH